MRYRSLYIGTRILDSSRYTELKHNFHFPVYLAQKRCNARQMPCLTSDPFAPGADPGNLQGGGGHESKWCPYLPIPKMKNSTDFGHFILVGPHFRFFLGHCQICGPWCPSGVSPVVPLEGLWCPWALAGLWCPLRASACGAPDRFVVPPEELWCP